MNAECSLRSKLSNLAIAEGVASGTIGASIVLFSETARLTAVAFTALLDLLGSANCPTLRCSDLDEAVGLLMARLRCMA